MIWQKSLNLGTCSSVSFNSKKVKSSQQNRFEFLDYNLNIMLNFENKLFYSLSCGSVGTNLTLSSLIRQ